MTPHETQNMMTLNELRNRAIQATMSHDWHCEPGKDGGQDKYSPVRSGWEKMAALFGVSLAMRRCDCKDFFAPDGTLTRFLYTAGVTARFHSPVSGVDVSVDEEGTAASTDKLLSRNGALTAQTVDEGHVQKKAITNAYGRAVTTLLGLGDVTQAELITAGLDVSAIQKTERKDKKNGGDQQTPKITQAEADSIKQEISQILKVLASKQAREKHPDAVDEAMPALAKEQYMILCKTVTQWIKSDGTVGRPGVESLTKLVNHVSPHVLNAAKALYLKESGQPWAGGAA